MSLGIPPHKIEIMLESNPQKSRILVGRLAVLPSVWGRRLIVDLLEQYIQYIYIYKHYAYIYIYIYIYAYYDLQFYTHLK